MMTLPVRLALAWHFLLAMPSSAAYKISSVDSAGVCNETIWLEDGPKSAAILRLTAKEYYDFTPMRCLITFKAPQHRWSGLTGVLEEVDLRQYEDKTGHHLARNECLDYIKVVSDTGLPQERQCGSWSVTGQEKLSHLSFRRALVGYCPKPPATGNSVRRCGLLSELTVEVSVGQRDDHYLWRGVLWRPYRGFTFVVTAYRYSYGEGECAAGLRSCGTAGTDGLKPHCVHHSLWCDHHINCGQPRNYDEMSCGSSSEGGSSPLRREGRFLLLLLLLLIFFLLTRVFFSSSLCQEMLGGLVTVMVGPWVGAALLLLLVLGGVVYWRRGRPPPSPPTPRPQQQQQQPEAGSHAQFYEVSSTLSSAHHMAIQVRVVCNSGQGIEALPWPSADLPPSYESLFPQGPPDPPPPPPPPPPPIPLPSPLPPPPSSSSSSTAAESAASLDITSLVSVSGGGSSSTNNNNNYNNNNGSSTAPATAAFFSISVVPGSAETSSSSSSSSSRKEEEEEEEEEEAVQGTADVHDSCTPSADAP